MVETFLNIEPNPSILRVETTTENQKTKLPPFLPIVREVTNEKEYETWFRARQEWSMPIADVEEISQRKQRKQSETSEWFR